MGSIWVAATTSMLWIVRASLIRWALLLVPAVLLAGFLSGELSGSGPGNPWFDSLVKPGIYPPPATFGIVWTILYVLMGLAFAVICSAMTEPRAA